MTDYEIVESIIKNNGRCTGIDCDDCPICACNSDSLNKAMNWKEDYQKSHKIDSKGDNMLKLNVWKLDSKTLLVQVKDQSEDLRDKNIIFKQGDYSIRSLSSPQLEKRTLFIRGSSKESDNNYSVYTFESIKECRDMIDFIEIALKELNKEPENQEVVSFEKII